MNTESAFPVPKETREDGVILSFSQPGLTKRELIAAMAMQGMLSHGEMENATWDNIAGDARRAADALLKELDEVAP